MYRLDLKAIQPRYVDRAEVQTLCGRLSRSNGLDFDFPPILARGLTYALAWVSFSADMCLD